MPRSLGRCALLCGLAVAVRAIAEPAATEQSGDEVAIRHVLLRFSQFFEGRDAEGAASLWEKTAPDFAEDNASLHRTLGAFAGFKLLKTDIRSLSISGSKAAAEMALEIELSSAGKSGAPSRRTFNETLELLKISGGWKLSRAAPTEYVFASELIPASPEERKEKLAKKKHLVGPELAKAAVRRGYTLTDRSKHEEAIAAGRFAKELSIQLGYKEGMVEALREIGGVYYARREYPKALETFEESLKLAREINYQLGVAKALGSIGNVNFRQGNLDLAQRNQEQALGLGEALGDNESIGWSLNGLALVHQQRGNFDESLQIQERIRELRARTADQTGVAAAFGNMGNIYLLQGRYARALEAYSKVLEVAQARVKTWLPLALNNMGNVYFTQGNYIDALRNFHRSADLAQEYGAKGQAADALGNIGMVHLTQGNPDQAIAFLEQSKAIDEEIGAQAPLAANLINLATAYSARGQYRTGLELAERALEINEALKSPVAIAGNLETLGDLHRRSAQYKDAGRFYERALELAERIDNQPWTARALVKLSSMYLHEKEYTRAMGMAARAATIGDELGVLSISVNAHKRLADANRAIGDLNEAERAYAATISFIEKMRSAVVGNPQEREQFFETGIDAYYELVDVLIERGELARALEVAERAKGRVLLDALRGERANIAKAMSPEERKREETLNARLATLNVQMGREASNGQRAQGALATLRSNLQKARLDYAAFEADLYASHPELRVKRGDVAPPNLAEVSQLLGGKRAALEFMIGKERSFLFALTPSADGSAGGEAHLDVFRLSFGAAELQERVNRLRANLLKRDSRYRADALAFYRQLIGPAAKRLSGIEELCIVPDGALWELPFPALLVRADRYLVEDYAVFYTPSLAVLREMGRARHEQPGGAAAQLFAVGNPSVANEMVNVIQVAHRDETLAPLPDAQREVEALRVLYGADRSAIFTLADAQEEQVKSELPKYRVLHFATHGRLDDHSPLYSHLVLSPPSKGSKEDGLLEAWEVMQLDLKADLAVLSACETARGRIGAGEGVIGMAWAFFVAGVPTTVVSHWKVESSSTTELMVSLHRNLTVESNAQRPISKAEALRRAELELMKKKRFRQPFYWASFAVVGNGM
jgi:CHAT domain-containing protein/lipopolysaccharide biosynthesis regulator YciM